MSTELTALVADADERHCTIIANHLAQRGWNVLRAHSAADLAAAAEGVDAHLLLCPMTIDGESTLHPFRDLAQHRVNEAIVMDENDDPDLVSDFIDAGAAYFFAKPCDLEFLDELLDDLSAELARTDAPVDCADTERQPLDQFGSIRGSSRPMRRMYRVLRKVAPSDASVLLIGESGTGKELVAQTIHGISERQDHPLIAMNCGAVPHDLIESELFGHEKGAFTGAVKAHSGYFERAHGGTLFLDEITEMPIDLQVKLLRVLETGHFKRVGGEVDLKSDVRIIAATNRNPQRAIEDGVLREDLYYRIASFPINLPALRKRGDDIVGLAQFFLLQHNEANDSHVQLTDAAKAALRAYDWPGNVRELISAIERAYVMSNGAIDADLLPQSAPRRPSGPDEDDLVIEVGTPIDEVEREVILATLESHGGDKKSTAATLGISLKTLYNRLNAYADADERDRHGEDALPD